MTRRAFSIIELVVVIGIIMILIGLTVPTLAGTRSVSHNAVLASNMRQIGQLTSMYCDARDGVFPVADERPDLWPAGMSIEEAGEAGVGASWPSAFISAGDATQQEVDQLLYGTGEIFWSATMYVHPSRLDPDNLLPWESLTTSAVYRHWAIYPSQKILLGPSYVAVDGEWQFWNQPPGQTGPKGPVWTADGSVRQIRSADLRRPDTAMLNNIWGMPIVWTWHGIRGIDIATP